MQRGLLKQSRRGYHLSTVSFLDMKKITICVLWPIRETTELRSSDQLIISYKKPHASVSCDTIARWIRNVLQQSGVDTSVYSAHSTRAASTYAVAAMGCPIADILSPVDWANAKSFAWFYNKQTDEMCNQLDVKILETLKK